MATPSTSTYLDVSMYTSQNITTATNSSVIYVWCVD